MTLSSTPNINKIWGCTRFMPVQLHFLSIYSVRLGVELLPIDTLSVAFSHPSVNHKFVSF